MQNNWQKEKPIKRFWLRLSLPVRLLVGGLAAWLSVCLAVLVCSVVWNVLLFGNPFDTNPFDDLTFNQSIWQEDASCVDGGNRRGRMAEDLLRHRLKVGMTSEQIQALLGEPAGIVHKSATAQWPQRFRKEDAQAEMILDYHVGEEFLGGGLTWIDLFFDKQGHYVRGRISTPPEDWRVFTPE